jgi:hypothetical protein
MRGVSVGVSELPVTMAAEDVEFLLCRFNGFTILSPGSSRAEVVPGGERPVAVSTSGLLGAVGT